MNPFIRPAVLAVLCLVAGCEQIAVLDGSKARDADAVAVGSACRHSGRALEDCYAMYPESPKAQVFAGWKEMNDYMTSNKIEIIAPTLVKAEAKADKSARSKPEKGDKADGEARIPTLPPTSAAATDPLAGLPKSATGAPRGGAKGAPEAAPARH
ncbi:MAG: hypothetical protein JNM90_11300 [Burkholderiales bacterium]|nr:hypothetical protein [Burkholderiales bacterium]